MNTKEMSELRRRWQAEKNAVKRIYGCYVNSVFMSSQSSA